MNKNTQKNTTSKAQTQQIVRLRKTKELFSKNLLLNSEIASLSLQAFSQLPKDTLTVLDYLLTCKYPLIWQSQINMAKNMGLRREDVNRALRVLRDMGLIDWFQRHNNSNVYRLHDIVYTYQFRQTYKHLFQGLSHPSFYALIPSWLRGISDKITLILKNYLYKNNFNYKEGYLSWESYRKEGNKNNNIVVFLRRILYSSQGEPINVPFKAKKRKERNYFPFPSSAPPLPQVLDSIKDLGLRNALEEYAIKAGLLKQKKELAQAETLKPIVSTNGQMTFA